jgi:hypothetical protein
MNRRPPEASLRGAFRWAGRSVRKGGGKPESGSPAVAIARAHVAAWGRLDFDTARSMLAPDVRVRVTTTAPYPPDTDLTGAEEYMEGLRAYAGPIVPGSGL